MSNSSSRSSSPIDDKSVDPDFKPSCSTKVPISKPPSRKLRSASSSNPPIQNLLTKGDALLESSSELLNTTFGKLGDTDSFLGQCSQTLLKLEQVQNPISDSNPIVPFEQKSIIQSSEFQSLFTEQNLNPPLPLPRKMANNQISLEAALRLLPPSFDGTSSEELEIFLEKCEFAIECADSTAQEKLLKGIQVRLSGKARQAIKFKEIQSWTSLKSILKSALEPQRTTTHLYLELYCTKQAPNEDVISYANRVECLQSQILEQETNGKSTEAATALEQSLKAQTVQVFTEGLHNLKDFIKARNPPTLEKAIQAAREEERVRKSWHESRKFTPTTGGKSKVMCFNCTKTGHLAKDCRSSSNHTQKPSIFSKPKSNSQSYRPNLAHVQMVVCRYCKKPGHTLEVCRKRQWVNNKKQSQSTQEPQTSNSGNETRQATFGGKPVSSIKLADLSILPQN